MIRDQLEKGDEPSLHSFPGDNNHAETDENSPPPLLHSSISTLESTSASSSSVPASLAAFPSTTNLTTNTEPPIQSTPTLTSASSTSIPAALHVDTAQASSSSPTNSKRLVRGKAPFPQLLNNPPSTPDPKSHLVYFDDRYDESGMPYGFDRTPINTSRKKDPREEDKVSEEAIHRMHKYTLYETAHRFYIVGSDLSDTTSRILKIDRTADDGELSITEDDVEYTRTEMNGLLATIEDGNKSTGGLKLKMHFWGILGFIRFTGPYYMLLITKRSIVGVIGGHYIYQIENTELVPLTDVNPQQKPKYPQDEARFLGILGNLDLTRSFYFSYSYDITRTLQHNIIRAREALSKGLAHPEKHDYNDMFAWNHYLLQPAVDQMKNPFDWCLPIIHGYVDQSNISVYGRQVYITIIARRSRYFAGARFLKRGANDLGYVANDVETEQIVSEQLTTSFHWPNDLLYANPTYTSYVQHRGSIPLFWTQENNAATPKPPIELNVVDPFFSAAALHFDNMFERYGTPIIVLNLVKSRERQPRESLLLKEFTQAISYLNQFLPKDKEIRHIAWDMSRASKSHGLDVIETLETIAENVLNTTGFFHNGCNPTHPPKLQNGVCRTNCIDCLDRTNAAQFVIGKRALGQQLHALGIISETSLEFDTDAVNLFTHMYHDHGDTIAVQYAGSHLVNTMETYRKINQWTSHSRDMIESFKRYYNNSFLDGQRQEAYNLFLGNYIFVQGQPMLWDLSTDYYLHHADPRDKRRRRSYKKWWTPSHLRNKTLPETAYPSLEKKPVGFFDNYWNEYYRPRGLTSFHKMFTYNMNSTLRYIPHRQTKDGRYDLSPFRVRTPSHTTHGHGHKDEKHKRKKPPSLPQIPWFTTTTPTPPQEPPRKLLPPPPALPNAYPPPSQPPPEDLPRSQWPLATLVSSLVNPSVPVKTELEYRRYIDHPLKLELAVYTESSESAEISEGPEAEYIGYVNGYDRQSNFYNNSEDRNDKKFQDGKTIYNYNKMTFVDAESEKNEMAFFEEYCTIPEDPLTVREGEEFQKRYKAYSRSVGGLWILGGEGRNRERDGLRASVDNGRGY